MRILVTAFVAAVATLVLRPGVAQDSASYPNKPVTLVVPYPAGGPTDAMGRIIAQKLTERLGKQVIVENRPGAGGSTGTGQVARATPNGYTLLMGSIATHGINPSLYKSLPYDHRKDFIPVSEVAYMASVLVANSKLPVKTIPELIAYLKQNPGKVFYASPGSGTSIHLAAELFKSMTGTDMTHVPYKGSAPAMQDVMGGQVQLMFDNSVTAWPQVKAGNVRAIGVSTPERLKMAPDLPAIAEFLPGFSVTAWHGVFAPAGTPRPIIDKLSKEIQAAMREPEMIANLAKFDITPVGNTPEQFASFINDETERWATVITRLGLKVD